MDQPSHGAEPNIAVLPDGTIFIVAAAAGSHERPNAAEGAAWLWRSTDDGQTWQTLQRPQRDSLPGTMVPARRPFWSFDADVVASPDGWVYYSDFWHWGYGYGGGAGSFLVERSGDGGKTWESTSLTTLDTIGGLDRQWLVAGPKGFLGLFYSYSNGGNPTRPGDLDRWLSTPSASSIEAMFSNDHGRTWTKPGPVVPPSARGYYYIGHPRLLDDGTLWMPYGFTAAGDSWVDPSEVRVAVSKDHGTTWTSHKVADVPGGFDSIWPIQGASDHRGVFHVAWAAREGEHMTIRYGSSSDRGETWTTPRALSHPGLALLPWIAARGDGEVAVGWYGSNATGNAAKAPAATEWFAFVARRFHDQAPFLLATTQPAPVKVGPLCPRGSECVNELLDYLGVEFSPSGTLLAAYTTSREVAARPI